MAIVREVLYCHAVTHTCALIRELLIYSSNATTQIDTRGKRSEIRQWKVQSVCTQGCKRPPRIDTTLKADRHYCCVPCGETKWTQSSPNTRFIACRKLNVLHCSVSVALTNILPSRNIIWNENHLQLNK